MNSTIIKCNTFCLNGFKFIKFGSLIKRNTNSFIPKSPTWDLINEYKLDKQSINIDAKKLEALSLISVDEKLVEKLENVLQIVERMVRFDVGDTKELIHFKHIGVCELRNDELNIKKNDNNNNNNNKINITINAKQLYDNDYFVAPIK